MNTSNNIILITGGCSGSGLRIARSLAEKGNTVIITGCCKSRLADAAGYHKNIVPLHFDVTSEKGLESLIAELRANFSELNVFINNAGQDYAASEAYELSPCEQRFASGYLSGIQITEELLPMLSHQEKSAIIDLSLVTLQENGISRTAGTVRNAVASYFDMLRFALKKVSNVTLFDLQLLGLDDRSKSETITKRISAMFNEEAPRADGSYAKPYFYHDAHFSILSLSN